MYRQIPLNIAVTVAKLSRDFGAFGGQFSPSIVLANCKLFRIDFCDANQSLITKLLKKSFGYVRAIQKRRLILPSVNFVKLHTQNFMSRLDLLKKRVSIANNKLRGGLKRFRFALDNQC